VDVCHIDRRDYRTLTAQQFHEEYVDQGKPLLLYGEGLLTERAREKWSREGLVREYGEEVMQVLPSSQYATEQSVQGRTFNYTELKLEEFVGLMEKWAIGMKPTLSVPASHHYDQPYIFRRVQLDSLREDIRSEAIDQFFVDSERFSWSEELRAQNFVFRLGPTNAGVMFHSHTHSWSMVIHGAKRWFLLPPFAYYGAAGTSTLEWLRGSYKSMTNPPLECTQRQGELLFVPQGWQHADINLQDTTSCTAEVGGRTHPV
jgi:hypothetical protein